MIDPFAKQVCCFNLLHSLVSQRYKQETQLLLGVADRTAP